MWLTDYVRAGSGTPRRLRTRKCRNTRLDAKQCLFSSLAITLVATALSTCAIGDAHLNPRLFDKSRLFDDNLTSFTIVTQVYSRSSLAEIQQFLISVCSFPHLSRIALVWNAPDEPPSSASFVCTAPVDVFRMDRNSMNNRFAVAQRMHTSAIMMLDDDLRIGEEDAMFLLEVWARNPQKLVGFLTRDYSGTGDTLRYVSKPHGQYSIVLVGASVFHIEHARRYNLAVFKPLRALVDDMMNCDDLVMNAVIASTTGFPPLQVEGRVEFLKRFEKRGLSESASWYFKRDVCLQSIRRFFNGALPLRREVLSIAKPHDLYVTADDRASAMRANKGSESARPNLDAFRECISAIILSRFRHVNLPLILSRMWMCTSVCEVVIVNNDPHTVMSRIELIELGANASAFHGPVHYINNDVDKFTGSRFEGCALARFPLCYVQDDDFIPNYVEELVYVFSRSKVPLVVVSDESTCYLNAKWSLHEPSHSTHTGFAWVGAGAVFARSSASKFLTWLESQSFEVFRLADVYFSLFLQRIPVCLSSLLQTSSLQQHSAYSCANCSTSRELNSQHMLRAASLFGHGQSSYEICEYKGIFEHEGFTLLIKTSIDATRESMKNGWNGLTFEKGWIHGKTTFGHLHMFSSKGWSSGRLVDGTDFLELELLHAQWIRGINGRMATNALRIRVQIGSNWHTVFQATYAPGKVRFPCAPVQRVRILFDGEARVVTISDLNLVVCERTSSCMYLPVASDPYNYQGLMKSMDCEEVQLNSTQGLVDDCTPAHGIDCNAQLRVMKALEIAGGPGKVLFHHASDTRVLVSQLGRSSALFLQHVTFVAIVDFNPLALAHFSLLRKVAVRRSLRLAAAVIHPKGLRQRLQSVFPEYASKLFVLTAPLKGTVHVFASDRHRLTLTSECKSSSQCQPVHLMTSGHYVSASAGSTPSLQLLQWDDLWKYGFGVLVDGDPDDYIKRRLDMTAVKHFADVFINPLTSTSGFLDAVQRFDTSSYEVTVCIAVNPLLERRPLLHDCLNSFCKQWHGNFNVVLAVDGTPHDLTIVEDIVRALPCSYPVTVTRSGVPGVSETRNWGIMQARTKWVVLFDADDIALPWTLKGFLVFALTTNAEVVAGFPRVFDHINNKEHTWVTIGAADFKKCEVAGNVFGGAAVLASRQAIEKSGGFATSFSSFRARDLRFLSDLSSTHEVATIPFEMYRYRARSPGSIFNDRENDGEDSLVWALQPLRLHC